MKKLFDSVNKRSLREEVYGILKKAIIYGKIEPQKTFYEDQLAKELGTSRTPIREATFKLEQEGLITKLPRGGFCVPEFSRRDIEEIFNLRRILEGYTATITINRITADDIRALEENIKKSEKALAKNRTEDVIALNTEFHEILYRACDSKYLLDLISRLRDRITRYRASILKIEGRSVISIEDHKRMVAFLEKGNSKELKRAIERHIETGKNVLLRAQTGKK